MKFQKPNLLLLLFSLPFFSVGVGFLLFSVVPTLYLAATAPHWPQVHATLEYANIERSYDSESTSYRAVARYRYTFNDAHYQSERVGIATSSDNIGKWQYRRGRELESALRDNRPVLAYVNPRRPEQAMLYPDMRWGLLAFKMIFVVIFGGFGTIMLVASFIKIPAKTKRSRKPVKQDSHSDHIYSGARASLWVLLIIAVAFTSISIPLTLVMPDELQSGNRAILWVLIFPLASLLLILLTIKQAIQLLRFGRSPLVLSPSPAGIGGHLNATIDINTPFKPKQMFLVSLCCINRKTTNSGKNSSTSETTRWAEEGIAYTDMNNQNGTRLRFAFNIPKRLPETEAPSRNYHFWRLDLEAKIDKRTIKRSFRVPVQKVENPQPATQNLAINNPLMAGLTGLRIAQLDMDDRGHEIEFRVPRFSFVDDRLFSFLFGSIFLGSGIGASIAGAPFIFALIFILIGSLFCLGSLYALLTEIRVIVSADGIYRHSSFIGLIKKTRQIHSNDYKDIKHKPAMMWKNPQGAQKHFLTLVAYDNDNNKVTVVDRIEGKKAAAALIEQLEEVLYGLKS